MANLITIKLKSRYTVLRLMVFMFMSMEIISLVVNTHMDQKILLKTCPRCLQEKPCRSCNASKGSCMPHEFYSPKQLQALECLLPLV